MKNTTINTNTNNNKKGENTMRKTNKKTRIIAAILAIVTAISVAAFATASASAAEAAGQATTVQSDKDAQKAKDLEELKKAKDGKEALEIFQRIIDRNERKRNEPKPDPIDHKGMTTVKTDSEEKDYNTFAEALKQAIKAKNASIKLHADQYEKMNLTIPDGCDINIDLNGFFIQSDGDLFTVNGGGVLHVSNGTLMGAASSVKANGTAYLNKVTFRHATNSAVNVAQGVKAIITNCTFEDNRGERGGAIYMPGEVYGSNIENNTFINNTASREGGAVYTSTPIRNCTFKYNKSAGNGGAVYYGHSVLAIKDCNFEGNSAEGHGGALYTTAFNEILGNLFKDNHSDKNGGAIYVPEDINAKISFSKFFNNTAFGSGGGIYVDDHSKLDAFALTLTGNEAHNKGGAIYLGALSSSDHCFDAMTITNNKAAKGGGVYCDAGFAKAADVYLSSEIIVKDNENSNFYLVKNCGKKAVLYTTKSFLNDKSNVYVNSSESGERAVVSLEEKFHENAFHGDNGRALERGSLHNYTLYIQ
ncbi:MAG: right-handed parallel beta-helix repeat-containing protein [Ruminococcus sp.]|nr:right-handed parallel beta-helix repeat-containing protein [Ruminococcus sp.]